MASSTKTTSFRLDWIIAITLASCLFVSAAQAAPIDTQMFAVNVPANDLVYSPLTGYLYASVPSRAGAALGNRIAAIDPHTGNIVASTYVGSEPTRMGMANDGSTLWVGLNGSGHVRRFDVASMTAGIQFSLGSAGYYGPSLPRDIAVAPGNPDLVAVTQSSSYRNHVGLYDQGLSLAAGLTSYTDQVVFGDDPSILYGWGDDYLRRMIVSSTGAGVVSTINDLQRNRYGQFVHADGVLYGADGRAVRGNDWTWLGTYGSFGDVAVMSDAGFVLYLVDRSGYNVDSLSIYDRDTFVPLATVAVAGSSGYGADLITWASHGAAFRTSDDQIYIVSNIPEPGTGVLLMLGLAGLGLSGRRGPDRQR